MHALCHTPRLDVHGLLMMSPRKKQGGRSLNGSAPRSVSPKHEDLKLDTRQEGLPARIGWIADKSS